MPRLRSQGAAHCSSGRATPCSHHHIPGKPIQSSVTSRQACLLAALLPLSHPRTVRWAALCLLQFLADAWEGGGVGHRRAPATSRALVMDWRDGGSPAGLGSSCVRGCRVRSMQSTEPGGRSVPMHGKLRVVPSHRMHEPPQGLLLCCQVGLCAGAHSRGHGTRNRGWVDGAFGAGCRVISSRKAH